ncbi:MAG: hypothetical protein LBV75_07280 [Paludibacter sp.]|jgi:uncharacterized membrane protein|nr:hypothetical protein [Paludibacter sp.]
MNNFAVIELIKRLNLLYYIHYMLTIVVAAFGFFLDFQNFISIGNANKGTISLIYIIVAVILLGIAITNFEIVRKKTAKESDETKKLKNYGQAATIRISLIGDVLLAGIVVFYLTKDINTLYCIAVAALALIYSKPKESKIYNDLQIED